MFRRFFGESMSIDLGTANTLVYVPGRGIVLNEPSVVALRTDTGGTPVVEAVGVEAKTMVGRTSSNIKVIRPLRDGVVADFSAAERMLQLFIRKAGRKSLFALGPQVLICVPHGATQVERRAIHAAAESAGARRVMIVEEPILAALGTGADISDAIGTFVLDIGGGTSEVALLSLNEIVYASSSRIGGDQFNQDIIQYLRREFGLLIGENSAERIKHEIGCACPPKETREFTVCGRDLNEGTPRNVTINNTQINQALQESLNGIANKIRNVLELAPPELISDIMTRGIMLTGGGALLTDIAAFIRQEVGINAIIAEDSLFCVVRGGGKMLEQLASEPARDWSQYGG